MTPKETFKIIIAESDRTGLPKHYRNDLNIDKELLDESNSQEFIYVLRTCGTHLLPLDESYFTKDYRPDYHVQGYQRSFSDSEMYFYHFSEGVLKPIDYETAYNIARKASDDYFNKRHLTTVYKYDIL